MDALLADCRYALRLFRKSPLFTFVAAGTLALGIGANTAIFSIVDAVVIRALPYADPDRVIVLWEDNTRAGFAKNTPAPANFNDWRRMNRTFVDMAATRGAIATLTSDGAPEQIQGRSATPDFFSVLGVPPILGRTFTDEEDRAGANVAVISYGLWQRRYGGDPGIVGRTLLMNDTRYDVVGVMPKAFAFRNRDVDFWWPMRLPPQQANTRNSHFLNVVGRLKPDVTFEAARDDLRSIARTLTQQYPDTNRDIGVTLVPAKEEMLGNTRLELIVLMAAAAAVLLIACANLASLLLSRAAGRSGELAVRAALGASRLRLARQMMVEGLMLSAVGALGGLALLPLAGRVLGGLVPIAIAAVSISAIDVRVLGFTVVTAIGTGLLFSVVPALQAGSVSLQESLQQQARSAVGGGRLTRDALVVLQIAAAVVLLAATGLMIRTLVNLRALDLGFAPDRLLTMRTTLPRPKYADPQMRAAFFDRVVAGVAALPGVEHTGYTSNLPFTSAGNTTAFFIDGRARTPGQIYDALYRGVTTDYLQTIGARLVEGRLLDARDGAEAPRAVVINETMARQFFPGESPIGHRMKFGDQASPWHTIVGVVHDVRERGYEPSPKPGVYFAIAQAPEAWAVPEYLAIRARRDPVELADAARRVITSVDPAQPIAALRTMDDILDLDVADRRQQMVLLGAFAALAVGLSSLGLYGLLAFAVAQRSREIGLRVALGATSRAVVSMFALRGVVLTGIGLAAGIAGAFAATRAMRSVLYGVAPTDAATFAAVAALIAVVATVASVIPAFRAARVDPMVVLRDS